MGVDALAAVHPKNKPLSRRAALLNTFAFAVVPTIANAVTVLNDDGEYVEVPEPDWQTTWKSRLDKASTMSTDQVFMAARGAGNVDPDNSNQSEAAKKRRAMAGCRDATTVKKTGLDTKSCTKRVLENDFDFILEKM